MSHYGLSAIQGLMLLALLPTLGYAEEPPAAFDRVEEDWEVVIDQPDLVAEGPQITTSMTPHEDIAGLFFAFNINYRGEDPYETGGLEVVAYDGDTILQVDTQHEKLLEFDNEVIRWTQLMRLTGGGAIDYKILNGQSSTWGNFGQGSGTNLDLSQLINMTQFTDYHPDTSLKFSGVGWQGNRVQSMALVKVRYYLGGELIAIDDTRREIDLQN